MYTPSWNSLQYHTTPRWLREAKFGIYTHWGIYCVPACGPNATWYPYNMYREGNLQYEHHVKTYGGAAKFGYKDFISQFTAEKFDAEQWAEVFARSGARFAGPVAEHHDGFAMWDTRYNEWNAARMGPKRDVVGELEKAYRKQGLKYLCAFHHAENWWFYPHWRKEFDTADPRYSGLYGPLHNLEGPVDESWFFNQERPSQEFLDRWQGKIFEVVDRYQPDMLWFDFGWRGVPERYRQEVAAYFYNKEAEWGREVALTYKDYDLLPGTAVIDLELGRMSSLTYHDWITDTTVDDGEGWGYLRQTGYKSITSLVHYLVDNVSKNGYLLLNVGPKPDGTLPQEAVNILEGMGAWLQINGEAIYGTTPWMTFGEGPTQMEKGGAFNEKQVPIFTAQDFRFTEKDNILYAICMGLPTGKVTLTSLKTLYPGEVQSVQMLGFNSDLTWSLTGEGLSLTPPPVKPCDHAVVFKITRRRPF